MPDRLRSAAARLTERAQQLLPGADRVDAELAGLDNADADAEPLDDIAGTHGLFELLKRIDPTPDVPLSRPHEVGFVSLVEGLARKGDRNLLDDWRVRRVLDLVGDRLTLAVGPDGVTVKGLLRRRHTPWDRLERVTFANRYELWRSGALERLVEDVKSKFVRFPIPGLSWLLRRVLGGIAGWFEKRIFTPEEIESLRLEGGDALIHIARQGVDIDLAGPLLLVSVMAPGFSEAVAQEARLRGVAVEVSEA